MSIEQNFNVSFVAELALREKQIQQNYRPIIAVHKWFARRPGTLFRASFFPNSAIPPSRTSSFKRTISRQAHRGPLHGRRTPLIEANRVGCDVLGFDINPMAAWIVREEIEHLDLVGLSSKPQRRLSEGLEATSVPSTAPIAPSTATRCAREVLPLGQGDRLRGCGEAVPLFPGYLLSEDAPPPANVLVCSAMRRTQRDCRPRKRPVRARRAARRSTLDGPASGTAAPARSAANVNTYPRAEAGPPRHRLFAIEYYNPARKDGTSGPVFQEARCEGSRAYRGGRAPLASAQPRLCPRTEDPARRRDRPAAPLGLPSLPDLFNSRQLSGLS